MCLCVQTKDTIPIDRLLSCVLRDPSTEEHLLPASPSEREIAVPVSAPCRHFELQHYIACSVLQPRLCPPPPSQKKNRRWTALCSYWPATSSTGGPTPGFAPTTSGWSTSAAPIRWSRTRPWSSSPSRTGRREVWKQCEESKQERVIVSLHRFNNCTIFHELNQTQMLGFNRLRDYCVVGIRVVEKAGGALVIWTRTNVYYDLAIFPSRHRWLFFQVFACGTSSASWCACAPFPLLPTPLPWTRVTSKAFPSLTDSSSQAPSSTSWRCMWSTGTGTSCTTTKVGNVGVQQGAFVFVFFFHFYFHAVTDRCSARICATDYLLFLWRPAGGAV